MTEKEASLYEESHEFLGSKHNRTLLGVIFVVLGIAGALVTYRNIFPIGSIILFVMGLILIFFWQRWIKFMKSLTHNG